jgi:hypothetical protein
VTYSSTSTNCGTRACAGAPGNRFHLSTRLNKNVRPNSRRSASHRSRSFAPAQPEDPEWEAVQEMFVALRPRFVGLAYTILRNKEDAEDAVQDALLSAYRHLRTFAGRSGFTAWFTRIVLNAALMIRRKRKPSWVDIQPESGARTTPLGRKGFRPRSLIRKWCAPRKKPSS